MRRLPYLLACALALAPAVAAAAPNPGLDDDWAVQRDPFDKTVIARYKAILVRSPHDAFAFAKLLEMYKRYRTLALLTDEYQKVLDKAPTDWATLVVLGRLAHAGADDAKALQLWTSAVAAKADDTESWLAIGELDKSANKLADSRAAYDKALAHTSDAKIKKQALRALADLALATGDNDAANAYFKQFLDLDPKNAQLWMDRGNAMLAAGKKDIALESYTAAEKLLGSDPTRRIEVVALRGQALEALGKDDDAIAEYRRAIKLAPKGYYLETELTGRIVDIYRRKQDLAGLLTSYEKEWPEGSRGYFEWNTLGKLYEETGAQDKAIAALRKAVAKSPTELDTQRRLIQLLENSGRDVEAIAQYEAVVRVAPGEARFQLELAERYWGHGQDKKALALLGQLEARFPAEPSVLSAVADLYQRWGKDDLAIAEYERLAKIEPDDPGHLVTLGEQYWQKGDHARATATWKRIAQSNKPAAFAKLGEVMAEHNDLPGAIANYDKAIKLDDKNPEYVKGRAQIYENHHDFPQAAADWERVLALTAGKPATRAPHRDAIRHLVAVIVRWGGAQEADARAKWQRAFAATPPDLESGYFLIEYYAKRTTTNEPRITLEKLVALAPDDQDLLLDLVKQYRAARRYDDAVALLKGLAVKAPNREREVDSQISEIMTEARRDDQAIEWAQKALTKSPSDPTAYERLGERYVEMQRFTEAIAAYEKTIQLDAHNTKAHFALAQLYVQAGAPLKAADLLRAVLRNATDDEILARAGNAAIDLEEMTDTLGELEKVVSPLSFMMAHKPIYRHILVDLYLRYVPRLVERERHGSPEVKAAAHTELLRIGEHGLQPLLEALRDDKDLTQQRVAVAVLGHLGNKGAAAPLVHMARQEPPKDTVSRHVGTLAENLDREVRVDALIAAGRLGDPAVINDVLPLLDNPEIAMREAATFTLGRSGDRRAVPSLVKALGDHRESVQTLACMGLGQVDDPRAAAQLIATVADPHRDDATRAACAYAIGARKLTAGIPALLATLADNRGEAQRLAAWALGQLGTASSPAKALGPLIRAYFARGGASGTEVVWAIARVSGAALPPSPPGPLADYPVRSGKFDAEAAIAELPGPLPAAPITGKLLVDHADDIAKGLTDALGEHRDVVVAALADLDGAPDRLALGALLPPSAATGDPRTAAAIATIGAAIAPAITAQLTSDDPKVRALALSVLAKLDGPAVQGAPAAIEKALADPADQVRAGAMAAIAVVAARRGAAPPQLVAALAKALTSPAWADRRSAALALAKLGPAADVPALVKAASDSSSFVREAVAVALGASHAAAAVDPLLALSADDIPQVRAAAATALALAGAKDDRAQKRRAALANDPEPAVRAAAGAPSTR